MKFPLSRRVGTAVVIASLLSTAPVRADSTSSEAKFASGAGTVIYLGVGTLLPLIEDGKDGKEHSLRTVDALFTSTLITSGLKLVVREKRPDSNARTSFPSGHATTAFAVATMQAHYHPKQALLWYGGATAIAVSRVQLNRHYWHDVAAGAAIGYLTSKWELKRPRGLILQPFIHSSGGAKRTTGLQFTRTF